MKLTTGFADPREDETELFEDLFPSIDDRGTR